MSEREEEKKALARKRRREELELRIGNTRAGYEWLRRVQQIQKGGTMESDPTATDPQEPDEGQKSDEGQSGSQSQPVEGGPGQPPLVSDDSDEDYEEDESSD